MMTYGAKCLFLVSFLIGLTSAEWTALPEQDALLEAFGSNPISSFQYTENWQYCQKNIIDLKQDLSIQNWEEVINKNFTELAKSGGGSVRLGNGTFVISRKIDIPEKCCLLGAGMSETVVRLRNKAEPFYPVKGLVSCSKAAHVSVVGMTIDGNDDWQYKGHKYYTFGRYGVSFERCNYAFIRNVRAVRNELFGFFIRGVQGNAAYHTYVDSSNADQNGVDGVKLRHVQYAAIYNSAMRDNELNAIRITGRSGRVLLRNITTEKSKYGVTLEKDDGKYPEDVLLRNVRLIDASHTGVYNKDSEQLVLETVTVKNTKDDDATCFDLKSMRQVTINNAICEVKGKRFETSKGGKKCNRAIVHSDICCPIGCETCGGDGCSSRGPENSCCLSDVEKSEVSCSDSGPPCILD